MVFISIIIIAKKKWWIYSTRSAKDKKPHRLLSFRFNGVPIAVIGASLSEPTLAVVDSTVVGWSHSQKLCNKYGKPHTGINHDTIVVFLKVYTTNTEGPTLSVRALHSQRFTLLARKDCRMLHVQYGEQS